MSDPKQLFYTIQTAVNRGDCLVFTYKKKDDISVSTRFVKPLSIDTSGDDPFVRTKQRFPVDGFRTFRLSRLVDAYRVIPIAEL